MTIEYKDSKRIIGLEEDRIGATASQGNNGGSGVTAEPYPAGGGGGAGSAGGSGSGTTAGDGGDGLQSDITGTNIYYAGGGGGGVVRSGHTVGSGGLGGGANGAYGASHATYYGGGGGGSCDACPTSGNGYQGIVILQFTTSGTSYSTTGSPVVDTSSVSGKTILKYTGSGSFILSSGTPDVRYLVVAGGGGGGAGGGGAGGFVTGEKLALTSGTYTITVGSGGTGGNGGGGNGNSGNDSVFSDITATGGGYGGSGSKVGGDGGSGGGANNGASGGSTVLITTVSATIPTDVQDNSLLIEKDTARRYWFSEALAPTYEDDFTSDNSVDQDASKISVNTAQERWDFNIVNDQTNDSSSIDIGSALSDSKWVMDFDYTWTSLSGTTNVNTSFFGISNSNGTVPSQTAQDHIGVRFQTGAVFSLYGCHSNNGTMQSGLSSAFTTVPSVTTLYFRIVRTSTTSMTVKIYTTSARTTVSEEKTVAVSASTTGLRYVKISPYEGTNGGSNTEVGYVKNLKIYNAVSTPTPATWTKQNPELPTVSGLYVHYDATDVNSITKDSNNRISQWNDKSGGERHLTQATSGNQPLWISSDEAGNPVIDFSDDRYMSDTWTAQSLPNTIFIVARLPVATASRTNIISGSGGNAQSVFGDGSNTWKYAAGSAQGGTKTGIEDTWQYIYALYGDDYTFEIGGELISGANCGTDTWTGMEVGASSGAQFGNMKIGEIIGYNVAVKGDDKTAIINYLKEKWERT